MSRTTNSIDATPTAILLEGPTSLPPEGVIPNVTNRSDEQIWYYVFVLFGTIIPGILLILRLYTKLCIVQKLDLTDYMVGLAFLLFMAMIAIARQMLAEGGLVHVWNLQLKHYLKLLHWLNINEMIYGPAIFLIKLGILLQYLRLFAPTKSIDPFLFNCAWAIIVLNALYNVRICTVVVTLGCIPREKIWNPFITDGHCVNLNLSNFTTRTINIVSDVSILILPARPVWRPQIARKKKIGLILLFALGLLACIANVIMVVYIARMNEENGDISYNASWMGLWALAEISFGIIVICTLTLPKLVEAKGKKMRTAISSATKSLITIPPLSLKSFNKSTRATTNSSTSSTNSPTDAVTGDTTTAISKRNNSQTSFSFYVDEDGDHHGPAHDLEAYPLPSQKGNTNSSVIEPKHR